MAKIGYDMDGVLIDHISYLLKVNNNLTGDTVNKQDITNWDISKFVSNGKEVYGLFDQKSFFQYPNAEHDAVKYFKKLYKDNSIFIVTDAPKTSKWAFQDKIKWIEANFSMIFLIIVD